MLKNILGIHEKDVVSIVGAGGKTTLLFKLANELSGKVCLTTTTKIFLPEAAKYDYRYEAYPKSVIENGRYLITGPLNRSNKLTALAEDHLKKCSEDFDYVLIEADGSKSKPLKGWAEKEPVIFDKTSKTVCILDISVVGKTICEEHIFRLAAFEKLISHRGNRLTLEHLAAVLTHKNGLLKNSMREKILFINKVEKKADYHHALKLIALLLKTNKGLYDKIIMGSLLEDQYYLMYKGKSISASILAAGQSERMGKDKLNLEFGGATLLARAVDKLRNIYLEEKLLIANKAINLKGIQTKINYRYHLGQSESIKLAVESDMDGYLLLVADQPFLKVETLLTIMSKFNETDKIIMCQSSQHAGNPTLIPKRFKNELLNLEGDVGAKAVIKNHMDDLVYVTVSDEELIDIDTIEDYKLYKSMEVTVE